MCPQTAERGSKMVSMRRSLVMVAVTAVLAPLALTACGDNKKPAAWVGSASAQPGVSPSAGAPAPSVPIALAITPASGKKDVPVSAEIGVKVSGATVTSVTVKDEAGKAVSGALREDGSAWVPGKTLKTKQRYAASVLATAPDGQTKTVTTSFTTMGSPAH